MNLDISLVPVQELPLQTVIQLDSCPADIGISYLQALCSVEGYSVGRDVLSGLSAYSFQSHVAQPAGSSDRVDLRRTLNNLQIRCTTTSESEVRKGHIGIEGTSRVACNSEEISTEAHPASGQAKARISMKKSEFLSYLDGNLVGDASRRLTVRRDQGVLFVNRDAYGIVGNGAWQLFSNWGRRDWTHSVI